MLKRSNIDRHSKARLYIDQQNQPSTVPLLSVCSFDGDFDDNLGEWNYNNHNNWIIELSINKKQTSDNLSDIFA